jgi:hypothetical protein
MFIALWRFEEASARYECHVLVSWGHVARYCSWIEFLSLCNPVFSVYSVVKEFTENHDRVTVQQSRNQNWARWQKSQYHNA